MDNFHQQVFLVVHSIPIGNIASYGQVAKLAGYPGYARQVGKLLSQLPAGSTLPWYRVVNSQGRISLKGEDLVRQRDALIKEDVEVSLDGKIALKRFLWHID